MNRSFEKTIARRYLRAKRRNGMLAYTTTVSVVGLLIGVGSMVIALSVQNGFRDLIRDKFLDFDNHIQVLAGDRDGLADFARLAAALRTVPGVAMAAPFVENKAVIRYQDNQVSIFVKGLDGEDTGTRERLERLLIYGDSNIFENAAGLPGMLIGQHMADKLVALPGDTVTVIGSRVRGGIMALPPVRRFVVRGYFSVGLGDYDQRYVMISLAAAQDLFLLNDRVTGVEVGIDEPERLDMMAGRLRLAAPASVSVRTWQEQHENLFQSMKIERWATIFLLGLIALVAAFNITSSMIMLVLEKRREIGIMMAMGATPAQIVRIFLYQGGWIAATGAGVGIGVGFLVCWLQQEFQIIQLSREVYVIDAYPVAMQTGDFLIAGVIAAGVCLAAAWYPARKASRLNPVEAIRYE